MKVIVTGSRIINDPAVVERAIDESGFTITELVSGGARGVDRLAESVGTTPPRANQTVHA